MNLNDLKAPAGARRPRKRVGRGIGSGHGKTATRGAKGQHARNTVRPGFEGGQTPLHRRLPQKRGFTNIFKKAYDVINLDDLSIFQAGSVVTPDLLLERKIVHAIQHGLKVLGDGEIDRALTVHAHAFSKSAAEKIAAAGGTTEIIKKAAA
jgi:large subunit ribosomal protein L15